MSVFIQQQKVHKNSEEILKQEKETSKIKKKQTTYLPERDQPQYFTILLQPFQSEDSLVSAETQGRQQM